MITNERRDKSLTYLAETDEPAARAKAYMMGMDKQEKTIIGMEIMKYKGKEHTVIEKEALARTSAEYLKWKDTYMDAVTDFELYRNKRQTEQMIIECWRSENANRRQGA